LTGEFLQEESVIREGVTRAGGMARVKKDKEEYEKSERK
jgi:hypothetical protein